MNDAKARYWLRVWRDMAALCEGLPVSPKSDAPRQAAQQGVSDRQIARKNCKRETVRS